MNASARLPNHPLFDTSYANHNTCSAIENLFCPKLIENLRLKNIDVFRAFENHDVYLYSPQNALYSGTLKKGKHVFLMDVDVGDPLLTEKENIERSRAVADAIIEKMHEIFPLLDKCPNIHVYSEHDEEMCCDRFDMHQDQLRQLAETLGCIKEFDQIFEKDDIRRAEAQEYVMAAERVLRNRSVHYIQISEIREFPRHLEILLAKPIITQLGESFGPEKTIMFNDREEIEKFYEDVIDERNAALSPMPRAAFDLTNKLGRLFGKPEPR